MQSHFKAQNIVSWSEKDHFKGKKKYKENSVSIRSHSFIHSFIFSSIIMEIVFEPQGMLGKHWEDKEEKESLRSQC